ncbi:MAG: hypothetical protein LBQ78_00025 [Tannerellaceae bacterium]|jgi:uncharacterized membrane protein|nr:hypothetical protein [Tannerellaceae bacterium]
MESKFVISDVVKSSWQALKSQIWILVGLLIGFTIIALLISLLTLPLVHSLLGNIVVQVFSLVISLIFSLGYTKNFFQALDGEEPQFSAYGQQAPKILTLFIANILVAVIVMIGTLLLIIPGIYLALRLQFFVAFIVEENAGILDSLKRSWEITDRQVFPLFLLFLAMFGIMIIGVILLGIGIFVATPLCYMISCYTFRKLNTPTVNNE